METFDDFRRRRFGGDLAASTSFETERPKGGTSTILRQRLHSIYETPIDEMPDAFRVLLSQMTSKLERD